MLKKLVNLSLFLLGIICLVAPLTTWADWDDFPNSNTYWMPNISSSYKTTTYTLIMKYIAHFSELTKNPSFSEITIPTDPDYEKILTIGEDAIPALKDVIINDEIHYTVRKEAIWLLPKICKSQKTAKNIVAFLKNFKTNTKNHILSHAADSRIYALNKIWALDYWLSLFE